MSFDLDLNNRRARVTGGTKGVGAAVVEALVDAGARVLATARSVPPHPPKGVRYIAADLSTAEGCAAVAAAGLEQLGGIDILVNVLGGSSAPAGSSSTTSPMPCLYCRVMTTCRSGVSANTTLNPAWTRT